MKKRNYLSLLLAPVVLLPLFACGEKTVENSAILKEVTFKYNPNDKTAYVNGVKDSSASVDLVIPETIVKSNETYTVVGVNEQAFGSNSYLRTISLPDTVKTIEQQAFARCTALRKINLGTGVETIGTYAFDKCSALISINVPDTCTKIGKGAFRNCTSLRGFDMPKDVTYIDTEVFSGDSALYYFTANSLTEVKNNAFYNCSSLKYVYYESSTTPTVDGDYNAYYTSSTIETSVDLTKSSDFDKFTFSFDPTGTSSDDTVIRYATITGVVDFANTTNVTDIPETVTYAGKTYNVCGFYKYAFAYTPIETITLPSTIKYANEYTFAYSNLKSINTTSMTSLGQYCFVGCEDLESVTFTSTMSSISAYCFYKCTAIKEIVLPEYVSSISSYTFSGCTSLTKITMYNKITVLNTGAFENCSSLSTINYTGTEEEWASITKYADVSGITVVCEYQIAEE